MLGIVKILLKRNRIITMSILGILAKTSTEVKVLTLFMVVIIITDHNPKGYEQETSSSLRNTNS